MAMLLQIGLISVRLVLIKSVLTAENSVSIAIHTSRPSPHCPQHLLKKQIRKPRIKQGDLLLYVQQHQIKGTYPNPLNPENQLKTSYVLQYPLPTSPPSQTDITRGPQTFYT